MADNGMEFRITTTANTAGAKEAEKALQANVKAAEHLNDKLKEVVPGLGAVEGAIGKMGAGATVATVAIGGTAAAIGLAAASVKEFMGVEDAFARLDAALARSGLLTDAYREKLAAMASELQKTTGKDDDEWLNVLTKLTQFGADASNIDAATEAVKNLAGILDGDLQGAAMMVSKALKGSFDMFGRYGLKVSETGTQTQKLNQLFEELAKRGGGQLEAQMTTLSGKTTTLWNNIKDVTKGIGGWIASTGIIQGALDGLNGIIAKLAGTVENVPSKLKGLTNAQATATASTEAQAAASAKLLLQLESIDKAYENQQRQLKSMASARDQLLASQKALDSALLDEEAAKTKMSAPELARRKMLLDKKYLGFETENKKTDLENERQGLLYKSEKKYSILKPYKEDVERDKADMADAARKNPTVDLLDKSISDLEEKIKRSESTARQVGISLTTAGLTLGNRLVRDGGSSETVDSVLPDVRAMEQSDRDTLDRLRMMRIKHRPVVVRPNVDDRKKTLKEKQDKFSEDFNENTEPRLIEIDQELRTVSEKAEIDKRRLESQWRKDTPDDELKRQAFSELDQSNSAQKASASNESMRQRYRRYYSQGPSKPSSTDRDFFSPSPERPSNPAFVGGSGDGDFTRAVAAIVKLSGNISILTDSLEKAAAASESAKAAAAAVDKKLGVVQGQNKNRRDE